MRPTVRTFLCGLLLACASVPLAAAETVFDGWNSSYDLRTQTKKYLPINSTQIRTTDADCMTALAARRESLGVATITYLIGDPTVGPLQNAQAAAYTENTGQPDVQRWNQNFVAAQTHRAGVQSQVFTNDSSLVFSMKDNSQGKDVKIGRFWDAVGKDPWRSKTLPKIGAVWVGDDIGEQKIAGLQAEDKERTAAKIVENILVACIEQYNTTKSKFGAELPRVFNDANVVYSFRRY